MPGPGPPAGGVKPLFGESQADAVIDGGRQYDSIARADGHRLVDLDF